MVLQTERLILREMGSADYADLAAMLKDPAVMYAYEHAFTDQEVWDWLNRQRARYARHGFGLWAAVRKSTGEMVGQAGLTMQPCEGEEVLEIGYLLKKAFWHRGYAREAAAGCRDYAFQKLGAPKVHAIIKTDNVPSIQVARAVGMKPEKEFTARYYNGERRHYLFSLSSPTRPAVRLEP